MARTNTLLVVLTSFVVILLLISLVKFLTSMKKDEDGNYKAFEGFMDSTTQITVIVASVVAVVGVIVFMYQLYNEFKRNSATPRLPNSRAL